jgi:hypothetical protein
MTTATANPPDLTGFPDLYDGGLDLLGGIL